MKITWLTRTPTTKTTAEILASKGVATKTIKMQQFIFVMTLLVIINAVKISAKTSEEEALDKLLLEIREKCIVSAKLSKDQANLVYQQKLFTKDSNSANTPKEAKCYCSCYLHEFGILVDGKPNEKVLRELLPGLISDKKKADAILDKCMKVEGKDKCEIGFNFELCIIKETGLNVI